MAEKKGTPAGSGFWQIIFPSILSGIVIVLVCVWIVIGAGYGNISRFAEISTVLLVLPVLFFSLIVLIILGACIALISRLMGWIPPITQRVLEFLVKVQEGIRNFTEIVVQPVIRPSALLRGFRNLISSDKSRYRIE